MLNLDLSLVSEVLVLPLKQPAYRRGRSHEQFLMNLGLSPDTITTVLKRAWHAH